MLKPLKVLLRWQACQAACLAQALYPAAVCLSMMPRRSSSHAAGANMPSGPIWQGSQVFCIETSVSRPLFTSWSTCAGTLWIASARSAWPARCCWLPARRKPQWTAACTRHLPSGAPTCPCPPLFREASAAPPLLIMPVQEWQCQGVARKKQWATHAVAAIVHGEQWHLYHWLMLHEKVFVLCWLW